MDRGGHGHGPVTDAVELTGGTQNILVRFRRGESDYVMRRPPLHLRANSNEIMRREARLLSAIRDTGVPHPRVIAACPDEQVIGVAFYLMELVDGFNATTEMPSLHAGSESVRHRMGLSLVEAIASLGALDYRALGLDDFGKPAQFLERQVARWSSQLESYSAFNGWTGPEEIPGVQRVASWLDAHRPKSFQPGILHGDYHVANVMYRHDSAEVAAIVDWELATIGDPLLDLGWLLATWPDDETIRGGDTPVQPWIGFPSSEELVRHYQSMSSRDLSAIHWYGVMACYKLGIILEGTHARACAGLAPRATGDRLHGRAISLFNRALGWID